MASSLTRASLFQVDRVPTVLRTAMAGRGLFVLREMIVHGKFLPFADVAKTHVKDVAFHDAGNQVGAAAMVYELGAAAAHRTVQHPIPVQREIVGAVPMAALL